MEPKSHNLITLKKDYLILIFILIALVFSITLYNMISENNKPLSVESVSPKDKSENTSILPDINVIFSRQPNNSEINQIKISTSPVINGSSVWNASKLSLVPTEVLNNDQIYKITLTYLGQKYYWSFKTLPSNKESQQDIIKIQGLGDQNFNNAYQQIYDQYPWYNNLPITTDQYFVYFDPDSKKFIAKIYIDSKSNISQDDQTSTAKQNILDSLKKIAGSDVNKYGVEWNIITQ